MYVCGCTRASLAGASPVSPICTTIFRAPPRRIPPRKTWRRVCPRLSYTQWTDYYTRALDDKTALLPLSLSLSLSIIHSLARPSLSLSLSSFSLSLSPPSLPRLRVHYVIQLLSTWPSNKREREARIRVYNTIHAHPFHTLNTHCVAPPPRGFAR